MVSRSWNHALDRLTFYVYYKLDWMGSIEFAKMKVWFAFATRSWEVPVYFKYFRALKFRYH